MKKWKKHLASVLCASMIFNLTSPAFGSQIDLTGQSRKVSGVATESNIDADEEESEDDIELIDDVSTASDADWDEELLNDLASSSDVDLVDDLASPSDLLPPDGIMLMLAEDQIEVTLDPNGGMFSDNTTEPKVYSVKGGSSIWLPLAEHPEKIFRGWYEDKEGNTLAGKNYSYFYPTEDMILYAQWDDAYVITYDFAGVTYNGKQSQTYKVRKDESVKSNRPYISTDVTQTEGKLFDGWKTESGEILSNSQLYNYLPTGNETLTAVWLTDFVTITFDYNGVTYNNKTEDQKYFSKGSKVSEYPYFPSDPEQTDGKLFKCWSDETGMEIPKISSYIAEQDETLTAIWIEDYYTITFDFNGVTYNGRTSETKTIIPGSIPSLPWYSAPDPEQTDGKLFKCWMNEQGEEIQNFNNYVIEKSETITAVWLEEYYTVTYDSNGGSLSTKKEYVAIGQPITAGYRPTKDGFSFIGWFEKESGQYAANNCYIPTGDVTLVASWGECWTITYDANGGTCIHDLYKSQTVEKGSKVTLAGSADYKKEGYGLIGWCEDPDCEGPVLTGSYTPTKDMTLYAKWGEVCTITLDAGDGYFAGGVREQVIETTVGSGFSIPSVYNENATLNGWYNDNGVCWTKAYLAEKNETLHARWMNSNCHTVTLHGGGPYLYDGKQGKRVETLVQKVEDGYTVGSISANRDGYRCIWYLDPEFKTPYSLNSAVEQDLDVYAKWCKTVYLYWDANGGRNTGTGKTVGSTSVDQGYVPNLPNVVRDGYVFDGWYTSDGTVYEEMTPIYENTYIYAKWSDDVYQVKLDLNGGMLVDNSHYSTLFYVKKGEACESIPDPKKDGAAFLGWYDADGKEIPQISKYVPERNTTITARWTDDLVQVRFHAGESVMNDPYSDEYVHTYTINVVRGEKISSSIPTPETYNGKTLKWWSLTENGEKFDLKEDDVAFSQDTDLYAVWEDYYIISFDYMGGYYLSNTAKQGNWKVAKGNSLGSPKSTSMNRQGYTFDGWYENTDYTGNKYEIPFTPDRHMQLFAKWLEGTVKKYNVTFHSAGGSAIDSQTVAVGSCAVKPENPKKDGCVFLGWYTDEQYRNLYQFTESVYKDIDLYAKWLETNDVKDATVEVVGSYTYNGSVIIPKLSVQIGSQELAVDTDYTVEGDSINAGAAFVTVNGIGNYTGTVTVSFEIKKAELEVALPEITIEAQYGDVLKDVVKDRLPDGWTLDNPNQVLSTLGKNQAAVTYVSDDVNYNDRHEIITVNVSSRPLDGAVVTLQQDSVPYNGQVQEPVVNKVTLDGKTIPRNDYIVSFSGDTVNVGTVTVTVTGNGNYSGSVSVDFRIEQGDPEVSIGNQVYEGIYDNTLASISLPKGWNWENPETVMDAVTSPANREYAADFTTYEGCNYASKTGVKLKVRVIPRELKGTDVKLKEATVLHDGKEKTVAFTVTCNGKELTEGSSRDYTVAYKNNIEIGTATLVVTGVNNYTGTVQKNFQIISDPYDLLGAVILLNPETANYTGEAIEPEVRVILAEKELVRDTDYSVEYSNNIEPGLGKVTVTGLDPYYNSQTVSFWILPVNYQLEAEYSTRLSEVSLPEGWSWNTPEAYVGDVTGDGTRAFSAIFEQEGKSAEFQIKVVPKDIKKTEVSVDGENIIYKPDVSSTAKIKVYDPALDRVLVEDTDYKVTYQDNDQAGDATVTVTGIGNYKGSIDNQFTIGQADPDVKVDNEKLKNQEMILTIKEEPFFLYTSYSGDGEISFTSSDDRIFTVEKATNDFDESNDGMITVKGIGEAKLTIEVTETRNYKGQKLEYTVKVVPVTISQDAIRLEQNSYTYTGSQIMPEFSVVVNGIMLAENIDYTVSYGQNLNAGEDAGSVSIYGKGDYSGTATVRFTIEKAENPMELPGKVNIVYGEKLNTIILPNGWKWAEPDNTAGAVGTRTIAVYLPETQDYKEKPGVVEVEVQAKELISSMVTLKDKELIFNGTEQTPQIEVRDKDLLLENQDYQLTYSSNIHAGNGKVIVTGTGNYYGAVELTFTIRKATPSIEVKAGTSITKYLNDSAWNLDAFISNGETLVFTSSNEAVAVVDVSGMVTMKGIGTTVITIQSEGSRDYEPAEEKITLTVKRRSSGSSGGSGGGSGSSVSAQTAAYTSLPDGYTGFTKVINRVKVPVYVEEGTWKQDETGNWSYFGADGRAAVNEWRAVYNPNADVVSGQSEFDWFAFDENGVMRIGWYVDQNGDTYYLNPVSDNTKGRMMTGWAFIDNMYYYFSEKSDGTRGKLLKNTVTPDGYLVDERGVRIGKSEN
ncbi:MAG: InlB B-repeat-containing protein [Brotaphodocola sp.]